MRRDELEELHYITPIVNLPSILARGILSHHRAANISHQSVAKQDIQDRRQKRIPNGLLLHDYVNLYICARNPMMSLRRELHEELCVLRVSTAVLDLPNVVIASQNASSNYVRFGPSPDYLKMIDRSRVFARSWIHPDDQIDEWRHKSEMCAEILVPNRVDTAHIIGAYVSCNRAAMSLAALAPGFRATINADMFFR